MSKCIFVFLLVVMSTCLMAQTAIMPDGGGTSSNPYQIACWENLYWLSQGANYWDKHYVQTADISFPQTGVNDIHTWADSTGWTPIGDAGTKFTGSYDGQGFTIDGLYCNRPETDYVGFFGYNHDIGNYIYHGNNARGVHLTNACILGGDYVGSLIGYADASFDHYSVTVSNCSVSGDVSGNNYVGGLIGYVYAFSTSSFASHSVTVSDCSGFGGVNGNDYVGGLIGYAYASSSFSNSSCSVTVSDCSSFGGVNGNDYVGGLVGSNSSTSTSSSSSSIENSYSTGSVSGSSNVGGLVGSNSSSTSSSSSISNSYSTGNVSGNDCVGGLVGKTSSSSSISNCYSTGMADGFSAVGGLVGSLVGEGSVTACFWDVETSQQTTSAGGEGKTTAEMQALATFTDAGWDFIDNVGESGIWCWRPGYYPWLSWQPPQARFSVVESVAPVGGEIQFTNHSSGLLLSYFWDFGDGQSSTEENPVHMYTQAGNYTVSLTVTYGENTHTQTDEYAVHIVNSGNGSEADPYTISCWQDLFWLSRNPQEWEHHFVQTQTIAFP